jgi:hypothetical protein
VLTTQQPPTPNTIFPDPPLNGNVLFVKLYSIHCQKTRTSGLIFSLRVMRPSVHRVTDCFFVLFWHTGDNRVTFFSRTWMELDIPIVAPGTKGG